MKKYRSLFTPRHFTRLLPPPFSWLYHNPDENVEVNKDTVINNILEPESSELLRLCYWINKSKQIVDKNSFERKFNEVKASLRFQNEDETKEQLNHKLTIFGRIIQDLTIPLWERELNVEELVTELASFRSNVSSFVPEFMLAALAQEAGFDIRFIPTTTGSKTSDLIINSCKTEIKTFLDSYKEGVKIESSLIKEIEGTLKRDKAIRDINESLLKKSEITFMFLTFSSLALGFAKYTFEKGFNFTLEKALTESISLAEQNRSKSRMEQIPVIVFTTLIDSTSCEYKIFPYMVSYPVKKINNNYEADRDKLTLKFDQG